MKKEDETKNTEEEMVFEDEEGSQNPSALVKKLREKLNKAVSEKQEYLTGWQKDKADFINLRKRDEEAKTEFVKFANQKIILEIIPIIDSFEQAFSSKESWETTPEEWRKGMESIYSQIFRVLANNGVNKFSPENENFDPIFHEAVTTEKTDEKEKDNKIIKVLQAGYTINGRVLRPAKVVVGEYVQK